MVAFTFVCREKKGTWSATRHAEEEGELEADASSTYDLQQKLYQLALENSSGGGVKTSFSLISPKSAVYQVIVGGVVAAGGGAPATGAPAAGQSAAAAAEEKKEEKKEEEEEEEDDDLGFSLFD